MLIGLREEARDLDQLSQRLDGLSAAVGQRLTRVAAPPPAARRPDRRRRRLVPDPGEQPVDAWESGRPRFQELRSGQLAFTRLSVVDRFGRAVNLFNNPQHFNPVIPPADGARPSRRRDEPARCRAGPRLLQPARLRFAFLSAATAPTRTWR